MIPGFMYMEMCIKIQIMKGKVLEKLVLREGWSRVHVHVDMKGKVSEKVDLERGGA